jgi:hypothetical protein
VRVFSLLAALCIGGVFLFGVQSWPDPSSVDAPTRLHVSPRVLERSDLETGREDPVSALLWDYRSVDAWTLVFFSFAVMVAFSAVARGLSRTSLSGPEFAEEEIGLLSAVAAAGAWLLGGLPLLRNGAFLNAEVLPQWVGPEHLRAAASWAWQMVAVTAFFCALLVLFRILRRRGSLV